MAAEELNFHRTHYSNFTESEEYESYLHILAENTHQKCQQMPSKSWANARSNKLREKKLEVQWSSKNDTGYMHLVMLRYSPGSQNDHEEMQ